MLHTWGEGLPPICLAATRLSPQELNTFAAMYHSDEFSAAAAHTLRAAAMQAPAQSGPAHMRALNAVKVVLAAPTAKCPEWLNAMCYNKGCLPQLWADRRLRYTR